MFFFCFKNHACTISYLKIEHFYETLLLVKISVKSAHALI